MPDFDNLPIATQLKCLANVSFEGSLWGSMRVNSNVGWEMSPFPNGNIMVINLLVDVLIL